MVEDRWLFYLVEATFDLVGKMLGPYGGKGSETAWGFDVTDDTDDDHRWRLDDSDGFDDLALVHLRSRSVEITQLKERGIVLSKLLPCWRIRDGFWTYNVGHTSLVAEHGGEVDGLGAVIYGERFDFTAVSGSLIKERWVEEEI